jgi:ribosome modulation factor
VQLKMSIQHELSFCLGCGDDCEHSEEEHAAFDAGVIAGCDGVDQHQNPYRDPNLREAWATGYAAGALSRKD